MISMVFIRNKMKGVLGILIMLFCLLFSNQCLLAQKKQDRRELFLDCHVVEKLERSEIRMHSPIDRGVAFYFDKPWEGVSCAYTTIIKDSSLYRAYYRGKLISETNETKQITCIAESKDGIYWYKPQLAICPIDGYAFNNIILLNEGDVSHNFSPFIDINPQCSPLYRYKGIGGKDRKGLFVYQSSDGIIWRKMRQDAFYMDGDFDSQNVAFWSPEHETYFLFFRKWIRHLGVLYRTIAMTSSKDFINWEKYTLLDFGDTPIEHLYTNQISFYYRAPQLLIGVGARLFPGKKAVPDSVSEQIGIAYSNDCSDVFLMSSRNAVNVDRTFMEAFIRPGSGYNNWTSRTNYPALNIVQTSDSELSIYVNENYMQSDAHLRRYSIRIDGFTSVHAGYIGGTVLTKSFRLTGTMLEINYSTSAAGGIQIELMDEDGKVLQGFSKEDCEYIVGDEISRIVKWKNESDLSLFEGKIVRMKFYLKDADVFSYRFWKG